MLNELRIETSSVIGIIGKASWDNILDEIYKQNEVTKITYDEEDENEFSVEILITHDYGEFEVELNFYGYDVVIGCNYAEICIYIYNQVQERLEEQII